MDVATLTTALGVVVSVLAIIGFSARSSRRLEVQIEALAQKVDHHREMARSDLVAAIGGVRTDMGGWQADLGSDITGLRDELKADITGLRDELKADIGELRTELKADIGELRTELKADVGELRTELRGELREGLGRIDARLTVIEQRTYDLSTRLPPAPAAPRS